MKEYNPRGYGDKVARASTPAVYYESGKVFHPKSALWLQEWEDELLMFPMGAYDDQVDNASMACDELAGPDLTTEDALADLKYRLEKQQRKFG